MNRSESIAKLVEALSLAQAEIKPAELDAKNPHFGSRYATLSSVRLACGPALSKNGLATIQTVESDEHGAFLETTLAHKSGEWISSRIRLLIEKQNMQGLGSALTYAKRYGLAAMVGVVDHEDDDGNAAVHRPQMGLTRAPHQVAPIQQKPATPTPVPVQEPLIPAEPKKPNTDARKDHLIRLAEQYGWTLPEVAAEIATLYGKKSASELTEVEYQELTAEIAKGTWTKAPQSLAKNLRPAPIQENEERSS